MEVIINTDVPGIYYINGEEADTFKLEGTYNSTSNANLTIVNQDYLSLNYDAPTKDQKWEFDFGKTMKSYVAETRSNDFKILKSEDYMFLINGFSFCVISKNEKIDDFIGKRVVNFNNLYRIFNFNGTIYDVKNEGDFFYVCGNFTQYNGGSANYIAKINKNDGSLQTDAFGTLATNGFNSYITTLTIEGDYIYVAGGFTQYNGPGGGTVGNTNYIAKINKNDGSLQTDAFGSLVANGFNSYITTLTIEGDYIYIGGNFTQYNGPGGGTSNRIAKINKNDGNLQTGVFTNGFNSGIVYTITIDGDYIYVGGSFTQYNGPGGGTAGNANRIAKINKNDGSLQTNAFGTLSTNGFNNGVNTVTIDGDYIYVAGFFTQYTGSSVGNPIKIAKINKSSGQLVNFGGNDKLKYTGFSGNVITLAEDENFVYVGGNFAYFGSFVSSNANRIAKLSKLTLELQPFGNGFQSGTVNSIKIDGDYIYVGGSFTQYNGTTGGSSNNASNLIKIDKNGNFIDTEFKGTTLNGFNGAVNSIQVDENFIYVGGNFTQYNGPGGGTAVRIAKIDKATRNLVNTFGTGFNSSVNIIRIEGNDLYVGGQFTQYNGTSSINYVAKLNKNTGILENIFQNASTNGFASVVSYLEIYGDYLYFAGSFTQYNGPGGGTANNANRIAKIHKTTGLLEPYFGVPGINKNGFNSLTSFIKIKNDILYTNAINGYINEEYSKNCIVLDISGEIPKYIKKFIKANLFKIQNPIL